MCDWVEELNADSNFGSGSAYSAEPAKPITTWIPDNNKPLGGGRGFGGRGRGRGRTGSGSRENDSPNCYKCKEEGHFARDCPNSAGNGNEPRNDPPKCYKCQNEGHMARNCPSSANSEDRPKGCFNCHEEGHISKDCPKGGGSGCRKCGEEGHFARDCQNSPTNNQQNTVTTGADGKPPPVTYIPPELEESQLFDQGVAAGINFSAFDSVSVKVSGKGEIPSKIESFYQSELRPLLLENVRRAGYRKPTPIQKHAIPIIMNQRDLMGCAQTGSGKTAAFLLPILHYILDKNIEVRPYEDPVRPVALVVAPTRELGIQTFNEARKFASGSILKVCIVYGGTSVSHQHKGLQKGCHLLVATPGRLLDYVGKGRVAFDSLKFLVLDEADRMLDMGFKPDMDKIIEHHTTPSKEQRQTLMFSATFPESIQELAKVFLNDYVFVVTGVVGAASEDVKQTLIKVEKSDKREALLAFVQDQLSVNANEKILVFVETKRMADFIALYLSDSKISATSIHGDRFQNQREIALSEFKRGVRNVLVATAVAARGLDIKGVGVVVNYDMPKELDEYVHRIGRTGRVGNLGKAYSYFDVSNDAHLAKGLIKLLGDGNQEIPNFLVEAARNASHDIGFNQSEDDYGAKDIRSRGIRTEEFPAAFAMGGPPPMNGGIPDDEECWD